VAGALATMQGMPMTAVAIYVVAFVLTDVLLLSRREPNTRAIVVDLTKLKKDAK